MAVVKLKDGKDKTIDGETGAIIWEILNDERDATEEQEKVVQGVSRIYLNWRNPDTPDSYIEAHKDIIFPMVVAKFMLAAQPIDKYKSMVIRPLTITRPEPSDKVLIEFCEKWGLIDSSGYATILAKSYYD